MNPNEKTDPSQDVQSDSNSNLDSVNHETHELNETVAHTTMDPLEQTLVAYLDGELGDDETIEIESLLATDENARRRLHELQKTWDMLDELPRRQADETSVRSTMEMVVTSALPRKTRWHRWPVRCVAAIAAFAVTFTIAFQIVRSAQNQPLETFVADMDFYENVEFYGEIQDIAFLERLYEEGLFELETVESNKDSNQERFAKLTTEELKAIKSRAQRFENKPVKFQQQIRGLHDKIEQHESRKELTSVMIAYHRYLKTLGARPDDRASFKSLDQDERLKQIRESCFGRTGRTRIPEEDRLPLKTWLEGKLNEPGQIDRLITEATNDGDNRSPRSYPDRFIAQLKRDPLRLVVWLRGTEQLEPFLEPYLAKIDSESPQQVLSQEARSILDEQPDLLTRTELLSRWCVEVSSRGRVLEPIDDEMLNEFFESELTQSQRADLDRLTPQNRKSRLQQMYHNHKQGLPVMSPRRRPRSR